MKPPKLIANSKLIDAYNDFIAQQRLTVVGARSGGFVESIGRGQSRIVDLTRVYIRNYYHVGDDGKITYGRMHGGFWQTMKSESRHLIRMNGEKVVILDYKAMILNIVAALNSAQLADDPYDIDFGFGDAKKGFQRELIKKAVIVAINSKSPNEAYQAMRSEFKDQLSDVYGLPFKKKVFDAIIAALEAAYPFLKSVFFKKVGKDIFMHDAEIARDIIRRFLDADKLVLPIHDGFVAQQSDKDFLMQSMKAAWRDRFVSDIAIDEE